MGNEGTHTIIFETTHFILSAYGKPHVSREEGGHLVIEAKDAIRDRTELMPEQANEYIILSMLAGKALELAMNIRGVPVVKVNYLDNGNWAFKDTADPKPHLHMHILGRASSAVVQEFPEAVKLPARESGFYEAFKPLETEDIREITAQIKALVIGGRFPITGKFHVMG